MKRVVIEVKKLDAVKEYETGLADLDRQQEKLSVLRANLLTARDQTFAELQKEIATLDDGVKRISDRTPLSISKASTALNTEL